MRKRWIYIQALGANHPSIALVYNNIGSVYRTQGDYLAALSCYEKALNIYQQIFGMEHSKTLNIYHYMADTYLKLQQYQEALPYFIKEMEYNIKLKGESDTCIYYSYSRIGTCYFGMSEYKSAVFYLLKACDYEEKNSVDVYYLASSLCQLGKCNDALPLFESIVDQFSGEDKTHVDILCANSIFLMGNYSIALSKHIEVLDARKELYKPDSDEIATSYSWVGRCYIMLGDAEKGISYLEENIRIASEDIWTSISWQYMGIAYQKLQNIEKASECFQKAFILLEDCSSSLYLQKARVFNSHAVFLLAQKDTRNANLQIQKALKFAHLYLDYLKCDEHPVLGHILMLQSDIIEAEQGTNEQVGQLRTQANEIFKEYLGVDGPFIRNPLQT